MKRAPGSQPGLAGAVGLLLASRIAFADAEPFPADQSGLRAGALQALHRGVGFFRTNVAVHGTYLWQYSEDLALGFRDERIHECIRFGLESLLKAQYPNGAWPQGYDRFPDAKHFPVLRAGYPEVWSRTWPTNQAYRLYFTRDYRLTYEDADVPTHYAFKVADGTESIAREFERVQSLGPGQLAAVPPPTPPRLTPDLVAEARAVIAAQDPQGRWIESGGLDYHPPRDPNQRVIRSRTLVRNVEILSRCLTAMRESGHRRQRSRREKRALTRIAGAGSGCMGR